MTSRPTYSFSLSSTPLIIIDGHGRHTLSSHEHILFVMYSVVGSVSLRICTTLHHIRKFIALSDTDRLSCAALGHMFHWGRGSPLREARH